ncbi:hypothetical protein ISCGN_019552 [Ixodes scapularis]
MANQSLSDDSRTSLPCFSLDEQTLEILWDEGVQMEDLLQFSFERIGKLAAARGVEMSDERKAELWQYVARMKTEEPEWLSLDQIPADCSTMSFWDAPICLSTLSPGTAAGRQTPYTSTEAGSPPNGPSDSEPSTSDQSLWTLVSESMLGNCSQLAAWDRPSQVEASGRLPSTKHLQLSRCSLSPISPAAGPGRRGLGSRVVAFLKVLVGSGSRPRRRPLAREASASCAQTSPLKQRRTSSHFRSMRDSLPSFVRRPLRRKSRMPDVY